MEAAFFASPSSFVTEKIGLELSEEKEESRGSRRTRKKAAVAFIESYVAKDEETIERETAVSYSCDTIVRQS